MLFGREEHAACGTLQNGAATHAHSAAATTGSTHIKATIVETGSDRIEDGGSPLPLEDLPEDKFRVVVRQPGIRRRVNFGSDVMLGNSVTVATGGASSQRNGGGEVSRDRLSRQSSEGSGGEGSQRTSQARSSQGGSTPHSKRASSTAGSRRASRLMSAAGFSRMGSRVGSGDESDTSLRSHRTTKSTKSVRTKSGQASMRDLMAGLRSRRKSMTQNGAMLRLPADSFMVQPSLGATVFERSLKRQEGIRRRVADDDDGGEDESPGASERASHPDAKSLVTAFSIASGVSHEEGIHRSGVSVVGDLPVMPGGRSMGRNAGIAGFDAARPPRTARLSNGPSLSRDLMHSMSIDSAGERLKRTKSRSGGQILWRDDRDGAVAMSMDRGSEYYEAFRAEAVAAADGSGDPAMQSAEASAGGGLHELLAGLKSRRSSRVSVALEQAPNLGPLEGRPSFPKKKNSKERAWQETNDLV